MAQTAAAGAAPLIIGTKSSAQVKGANDRLRIAVELDGFAFQNMALEDVVNVPARTDLMRGRFEEGYEENIDAQVAKMNKQIAKAAEADN